MSSLVSTSGRPSSSLHFVVGEMNGKLDQLMASILPQIQSLQAADTALDIRVVSLERNQWMVIGGLTLIGFIVTAWEIIRVYVH